MKVSYFLRPVANGKEGKNSEKITINASGEPRNYQSIRFSGNYKPQRIAIADLNGDGIYDFVIKQPERGIDPGGSPNTDGLTYKVEAYLNDGTILWRKDLGPGIEPGIWYSPMVVFDFNGDGKAEVAVKTGPEDARSGWPGQEWP